MRSIFDKFSVRVFGSQLMLELKEWITKSEQLYSFGSIMQRVSFWVLELDSVASAGKEKWGIRDMRSVYSGIEIVRSGSTV